MAKERMSYRFNSDTVKLIDLIQEKTNAVNFPVKVSKADVIEKAVHEMAARNNIRLKEEE